MSRATLAKLEELHHLVGDVLAITLKAASEGRLVELQDGTYVPVTLSPAAYAQALKFLSDNGVTQPAVGGNNGPDPLKADMPDFSDDTVVPFRKPDDNRD